MKEAIFMISQETKTFYAFNIDKMFKAVFVGTDEVSNVYFWNFLVSALIQKLIGLLVLSQSSSVLEVNMKEVKD